MFHLPMDARIQEREVLKIRPPAELPEGFRTELNANAKPTTVNLLRQEERHRDTK
jgi:hypothetical protein